MRLAHVGIIAVALGSGCLRFGYDRQEKPVVPVADAGPDAAAQDAAAPADAGTHDAAQPDAAMPPMDAAMPPMDAAMPPMDAATSAMDAAFSPQDSGMDAAVGGEPTEAGSADAGARDASVEDTGTPDAGTIDAAISDAAMEAGTTDPCIGRTDLLFCGGFDDSAAWSASVANNATVTTTTEKARSGSSSLHTVTFAASSSSKVARREAAVFDALTSGDIWARAYFYLSSSTVIDAASRLTIMRMSESQSPYVGCSVVIRPDYVELGGVTTRYRALSPFPRDRWTCVELHILIDNNADGACDAYVDGMQAAQTLDAETLPASGYRILSAGLEYTNAAQGPVDLYIDDVAASYTRVGCD